MNGSKGRNRFFQNRKAKKKKEEGRLSLKKTQFDLPLVLNGTLVQAHRARAPLHPRALREAANGFC